MHEERGIVREEGKQGGREGGSEGGSEGRRVGGGTGIITFSADLLLSGRVFDRVGAVTEKVRAHAFLLTSVTASKFKLGDRRCLCCLAGVNIGLPVSVSRYMARLRGIGAESHKKVSI